MPDTVTLPRLPAAFLVAGHLAHVFAAVQDEELGGCCPECCAPCWALRELRDTGQLDELMGVYVAHTGGEDATWDAANDRVDRGLLDKAWSVELGCAEMHDEMRSQPV